MPDIRFDGDWGAVGFQGRVSYGLTCNVITAEGTFTQTSTGTSTKMAIATTTTMPASGIERLSAKGLFPKNGFEAVILGLHGLMLDEGFVSLFEASSAAAGFAPPVRELPPSQPIPNTWNIDPAISTLQYRHRDFPGKQLCLSVST